MVLIFVMENRTKTIRKKIFFAVKHTEVVPKNFNGSLKVKCVIFGPISTPNGIPGLS